MAQFKQIGHDFFIGHQPTEQDLQEARQHGIKTVIDDRNNTRRTAWRKESALRIDAAQGRDRTVGTRNSPAGRFLAAIPIVAALAGAAVTASMTAVR
jgi:hypothetical protein